jgi:1,4-dihydroxy-2-naphthoyl-CoA hydrolase
MRAVPSEQPAEVPEGFADPFTAKLGIVIEEWSPERVVGSMPVEGNTQPYGILHGGATCSLVESLASAGAAAAAGWADHIVMGLQQTTNFIRAVREGIVRGVATPIHTGRTTHVWQVDITQVETGKLVASGRVTLAVRDRPK